MVLAHRVIKMKDFYMTLLSDSSMNMFPSNIQSEFTVKLDHPIEIDEESWEVALAEIAIPSEVLNITEDNNFFFLAFPDQHSLYTKFGVENITDITQTCACNIQQYFTAVKMIIFRRKFLIFFLFFLKT